MSEQEPKRVGGAVVAVAILLVVGLPLLVFLPLILALIEGALFSTDHVYETCVRLGIADELEAIYRPVFELLEWLLND